MAVWNTLHPHRHTGKLVAHHHTSYAGIGMLLLVLGLTLMAVTTGTSAATLTSSGPIDISGQVISAPPAIPPEVVTPPSGSHVVSSPLLLTGTCLDGLVVVVQRNGLDAGSVACSSAGTFSISIDLFNGRNDISARQYDANFKPSPQSSTVIIYFDQLSSQNPTAAAPPKRTKAAIAPQPVTASHAPLLIQTKFKYQGVFAGQSFDMPIDVSAGTLPYAISIDWGDSQSTVVSQPENGFHAYAHAYVLGGDYRVIIRATDSAGVTGYYQTAVRVAGLAPSGNTAAPIGPSVRLLVAWPIYAALLILVVGFWLGERYDANRWRHRLTPAPK